MSTQERTTPIVEATKIDFAYSAGRKKEPVRALDGFDLQIERGQFVSILGPSGCGKSTFLRLLAGLEEPAGGTLLYDGAPVQGPDPERGMLFQAYVLFPWKTVRQNVEFGPRARKIDRTRRQELVTKYLAAVGLMEFADRFPSQLSGGMQQRAALARMYANEPRLMLMDEPFGAVDAQTRALLQEDLLRLWEEEQRTVLFVTHSVEEAALLSDSVVVMTARPGRVKEKVPIELPRPRSADTRRLPEYHKYVDLLNELIRPELGGK